jgi:hypothetical protein
MCIRYEVARGRTRGYQSPEVRQAQSRSAVGDGSDGGIGVGVGGVDIGGR